MLTIIPFSGFYESIHDENLSGGLADLFTDHETGLYVNHELLKKAYNAVDWEKAHRAYAREYTEAFAREFDIEGLEFDSLDSPQFYNYSTDRIFATITERAVSNAFDMIDIDQLTEVCARKFTSRDGFASHYSPDWKTWGKIEKWDYNQIGCILECLMEDDSELYLMDDVSGNGGYAEILINTPEMARLDGLHYDMNQLKFVNEELEPSEKAVIFNTSNMGFQGFFAPVVSGEKAGLVRVSEDGEGDGDPHYMRTSFESNAAACKAAFEFACVVHKDQEGFGTTIDDVFSTSQKD